MSGQAKKATRHPSVRELLEFARRQYAVTVTDTIRAFGLNTYDKEPDFQKQVKLRAQVKETVRGYMELAGLTEESGAWSLPLKYEDDVDAAVAEWVRRHGPYADMPLDAYVEFAKKHGWDLSGAPSTRDELEDRARRFEFDAARYMDLAAAASEDISEVDWLQSLRRWLAETTLALRQLVQDGSGQKKGKDPSVWVWAATKIAEGVKARHVAEACGCSVRHMYRCIKDVPDPLPDPDPDVARDLDLKLAGVQAQEGARDGGMA